MIADKALDALAIEEYAKQRGVTRLVHFTPFLNLLGIFNSRKIMSRQMVSEYAKENKEQDLMAYVSWNDKLRLDKRMDCINLSVQRINAPLFARFKKNFRQGGPWCILEIDPICLGKRGAQFTVANAASTSVRRFGTTSGLAGFQALFQDEIRVSKWQGVDVYRRTNDIPTNHTTCVQAEVLYPGEIPISLIRGLIFESKEDALRSKVMLGMENPNLKLPPIKITPEEFK